MGNLLPPHFVDLVSVQPRTQAIEGKKPLPRAPGHEARLRESCKAWLFKFWPCRETLQKMICCQENRSSAHFFVSYWPLALLALLQTTQLVNSHVVSWFAQLEIITYKDDIIGPRILSFFTRPFPHRVWVRLPAVRSGVLQ